MLTSDSEDFFRGQVRRCALPDPLPQFARIDANIRPSWPRLLPDMNQSQARIKNTGQWQGSRVDEKDLTWSPALVHYKLSWPR